MVVAFRLYSLRNLTGRGGGMAIFFIRAVTITVLKVDTKIQFVRAGQANFFREDQKVRGKLIQ
jgi:hypothetical protein